MKSLASFLNVPLVIGDATSLTEAGYVGEDVESLLSRLIQAANGDLGAAQGGIVYIDEIDKIRAGGSGLQGPAAGRPARLAQDSRRHGRHGATSWRLQASDAAGHSLRHDQRPVYLRRGVCRSGRHHRQEARAGWFRIRSVV